MLTKFLAKEKEEEERQNLVAMLIDASDGLSETINHLNDVVQANTGAFEKIQSVNLLKTLEGIEKKYRSPFIRKERNSDIRCYPYTFCYVNSCIY